MTTPTLDRERLRELFDLRSSYNEFIGGRYHDDPYPIWHRLREQGPVLPGILHELTGFTDTLFFHGLPYPDRPHFTVFDYETGFAAYRNPEVFASSPEPVDLDSGPLAVVNSMLSMDGAQHKRYRTLVQPSFLPANGKWWIENWITETVRPAHRRLRARRTRRTQRRLLRCHPDADHHRQLRRAHRAGARHPGGARNATRRRSSTCIRPIVAARREQPQDDLISVLVQAELTDDDGATTPSHRSRDRLVRPAAARRGLGHHVEADGHHADGAAAAAGRARGGARRPAAARGRPSRSRVRWMPTDPMFSRWVIADTELGGVEMPAGSVVHIGIGAANRDPARWDRPDEFDITRKLKPSLGFGQGTHICLGMHVARAEMTVAISALLDRLPNLRLDPDAEPPRFVGMYERGATAIPVLFDPALRCR